MKKSINLSMLTTEDVINAGCFGDSFNTIACSRYALMSTILFITAILCIVRLYKLHKVHHADFHPYLIFYGSTICCLICVVHWVTGRYAQLDFIAQWFKEFTYLVVVHSFWTRAHTALRAEKLINCCLIPALVLALMCCTAAAIYGAVEVADYKTACNALVWLLMSSAELFVVQTFLLAALFISKRLDAISTVQSVRLSQKRKLWGLVIVFEFSAMVGFSYDMVVRALSKGNVTCSEIFNNNQLLYSIIFGIFMVIKFALPIWAMLGMFDAVRPPQFIADEEDDSASLQESSDQHTTSDSRTIYIPRLFQALRRADPRSPPS